jgi:NADH-quinone oxidoreductase subunit K
MFNFLVETSSNLYFIAIVGFCIYLISICGLLFNLKNILISLFFVELAYFSLIVFLLIITVVFNIYYGFLYALFLILLAASESAVGLGILIFVYTFEKKITFDNLIELI